MRLILICQYYKNHVYRYVYVYPSYLYVQPAASSPPSTPSAPSAPSAPSVAHREIRHVAPRCRHAVL